VAKCGHKLMVTGKSCLQHVLVHSPYELNASIKYMLARDVCSGALFLHKRGLLHGLLDPWNVLLDRNWTAKLGNWAQLLVAELEGELGQFAPASLAPLLATANDDTCKRLLFR